MCYNTSFQVWAGVELQNQAFETFFRDWSTKLEFISNTKPESFNLIKGIDSSGLKGSKPVKEQNSESEDEIVWDESDGGEEGSDHEDVAEELEEVKFV